MAGTEDVGRRLALVMVVRTGTHLLPGVGQGHLGVVHVEAPHDGAVVVLDRRAGGAGGRGTGTGSAAAARTADEGLPFGTAGSAELEEVGGRGTGAAVDVDAARGTAAAGLPTIGSGRGTGSASGGGSIGHLNIFGRRRRRGGEAVSRSAAARLVAEAAAHGIEEVGYDHHGWLYLLSFDSLLSKYDPRFE